MNDCAVVGAADALKGQVPIALLIVNDGVTEDEYDSIISDVKHEIREQVSCASAISFFRCALRSGQIFTQLIITWYARMDIFQVGHIASLAAASVVHELPKTRSGKVLRKNIRGFAEGKEVPVPGTVDNPEALAIVRDAVQTMGFPRL